MAKNFIREFREAQRLSKQTPGGVLDALRREEKMTGQPPLQTFFAEVLVFTCHKCGKPLRPHRRSSGRKGNLSVSGKCPRCRKTWQFAVTVKEK